MAPVKLFAAVWFWFCSEGDLRKTCPGGCFCTFPPKFAFETVWFVLVWLLLCCVNPGGGVKLLLLFWLRCGFVSNDSEAWSSRGLVPLGQCLPTESYAVMCGVICVGAVLCVVSCGGGGVLLVSVLFILKILAVSRACSVYAVVFILAPPQSHGQIKCPCTRSIVNFSLNLFISHSI